MSRMAQTPADLDALPEGSVILGRHATEPSRTEELTKLEDGTWKRPTWDSRPLRSDEFARFPILVLHRPTPGIDRIPQIVADAKATAVYKAGPSGIYRRAVDTLEVAHREILTLRERLTASNRLGLSAIFLADAVGGRDVLQEQANYDRRIRARALAEAAALVSDPAQHTAIIDLIRKDTTHV